MKRIFLLIALVGMMTGVYAQQSPLVTLSHNGELSFFSKMNAFETALDSAVNGDIIYLSEGSFTSGSTDLTIDKRISIIGCGYKSHILANLEVNMYGNPNSYMDAPLFDGVRLQKLAFNSGSYANNDVRDNLKEVVISNTWINDLSNGGYAGNDFKIDRCYIEIADFGGSAYNNTSVQNSKIGKIRDGYSDEQNISVINSNIGEAYYCPRTLVSSIIGGSSYSEDSFNVSGTHSIYNSLFPSKTLVDSPQIFIYDCYFDAQEGGVLNENLEAAMDLQEKGYLGQDGTVIGIYGGMSPYSETPSVPTVDPANSSVTLDKDKNQLNVTITVKE